MPNLRNGRSSVVNRGGVFLTESSPVTAPEPSSAKVGQKFRDPRLQLTTVEGGRKFRDSGAVGVTTQSLRLHSKKVGLVPGLAH